MAQMPGWAVGLCVYHGDDALWQVAAIDLRPRGRQAKRDVLAAILTELSVEAFYVSAEMEQASPELWTAYAEVLSPASRRVVSHAEFRALVPTVKYAVRTGEYSPYANPILVGGVGGIVSAAPDA
jgi:D-ribose pyranase